MVMSLPVLISAFVGEPTLELLLGNDVQKATHLVVTETTELGAGKLELAFHRWLEPDIDRHPRNGVLLDAKVRQVKAVEDIHAA